MFVSLCQSSAPQQMKIQLNSKSFGTTFYVMDYSGIGHLLKKLLLWKLRSPILK